MTPEQYDHWYASGRGRWIGETEFRLLSSELDCQPGDKVLDVGCGTGWFTRRIAGLPHHLPLGGFLLVAGDKAKQPGDTRPGHHASNNLDWNNAQAGAGYNAPRVS